MDYLFYVHQRTNEFSVLRKRGSTEVFSFAACILSERYKSKREEFFYLYSHKTYIVLLNHSTNPKECGCMNLTIRAKRE